MKRVNMKKIIVASTLLLSVPSIALTVNAMQYNNSEKIYHQEWVKAEIFDSRGDSFLLETGTGRILILPHEQGENFEVGDIIELFMIDDEVRVTDFFGANSFSSRK